MFKKSTKNLINKLKPRLVFNKFNLNLLVIYLAIQAVFSVGAIYLGTYQFNWVFLKNNYIQIIIIYIVSLTVLFLSFRESIKKAPYFSFIVFYLLLTLLLVINTLGLTYAVESITSRASFFSASHIFITFILAFTLLLVSRYDFPITTNFIEFYIESVNHFKRNIGVYLAIAVLVSILSFYAQSFVFAVVYILIIDSVYLLKALLSNVRK